MVGILGPNINVMNRKYPHELQDIEKASVTVQPVVVVQVHIIIPKPVFRIYYLFVNMPYLLSPAHEAVGR